MQGRRPRLAFLIVALYFWMTSGGDCRGQTVDELQKQLTQFEKLVDQQQWKSAERQAQKVLAIGDIVCRDRPAMLAGFSDMMGQFYVVQKRYDLAEPMYARSLQLYEKANGKSHTTVADTLQHLGDCLYYQRQYAEAINPYQQALQLRQRLVGPNELITATAWRDLAWCYYDSRDYDKAVECYQHTLEIREKQLGPAAAEVANALIELADARYNQQRFEEALAYYERALAIRRKLFEADDDRIAATLFDLGDCLRRVYRLPEAEAACRQAMEMRIKQFGADSTQAAGTMRNLGSVLVDLRKNDEAEQLFKQALAIEERAYGENDMRVARSLDMLARIRQHQGRLAEAEPLYRRSLAVREKAQPADETAVAIGCNNLATLLDDQGRYAEAEPFYRRALSIRERTLAADDPTVAESLNNVGALLRHQGRSREAQPYYQRALAIREKRLPANHPDLATSLRNLANLYSALAEYDKAEPLYIRALEIMKQVYGPNHAEVAHSESTLADLYWNQGRTALAEPLYENSLKKMEAALGPNHPELAYYIYNVAWCRNAGGQTDAALELLDQAINIDRQFTLNPKDAFNVYFLRAKVHRKVGHKSEALRDLSRAMEMAEKLRSASSGAELERAEFFAGFSGPFELMVAWQLEDGDIERALDAIERSRARSLLDEIGLLGADLEAGRPAHEEEQFRRRAGELRSRLAELETRLQKILDRRDKSPDGDAERQQIEQQIAQTRDELYKQYRDSRASSAVYQNLVNHNAQLPSLGEVQRQLLNDKSLLLIYLLGNNNGYLIAITDSGAELSALAVGEDDAKRLGIEAGPLTQNRLQELLLGEQGIMRQLSNPRPVPELKTRLAALWRVLIPEAKRTAILAGEFKRLHVVPNGPLAFLPLEVLVTAETGETKYLLDSGPPIYYAPSVTVLDSLRIRPQVAAPASREPVLSVGDPQYGAQAANNDSASGGASRALLMRSRLTALPYSGLEARWVREAFDRAGMPTLALTSQKATEAEVRTAAPGRRIIHLACHGFADQAYGNLFGALALSAGAGGDSNPSDDGLLNLAEIYDLGLRGCELAILSACETNYGPQQQGEGVWTLSRGFLVAGARRVVASNWVVDDEAAASLVSYFCAAAAKAQQKAEADNYGNSLLAAKRYIRCQKKWEAPYYWASMVLIGPR